MKISAITYSNYQVGFPKASSSDPAAYSTPAIVPAYGPTIIDQTSQVQDPEKTGQNNDQTDTQSNNSQDVSTPEQNFEPDTTTVNGQALTQEQMRVLDQLRQVDTQVRRHEMAHVAAGGRYITSGATFSYQKGPDGRNYAIGGEVGIDTAPIPGDPQATIQKMRQIKSAALAPANPSAQDMKVASQATSNVSKALSELMVLQAKEQAKTKGNQAFGNLKNAANSYEKVNNLPETDTSSFQIAV
ncbi:MAG: putative metalloprotease CJM1_0395 family protein [Pseudomonadota bacterium]